MGRADKMLGESNLHNDDPKIREFTKLCKQLMEDADDFSDMTGGTDSQMGRRIDLLTSIAEYLCPKIERLAKELRRSIDTR